MYIASGSIETKLTENNSLIIIKNDHPSQKSEDAKK